MKKHKIIYWTTTIILFLFDSLLPALTSHTDLAKQGISHLGYPDYFRTVLTIFKIIGGLLLIIPAIPARIKEWAYVGFALNFICAFISLLIVDGMNGQTIFPLVILGILVASYISYHKLNANKHKVSEYRQNVQLA